MMKKSILLVFALIFGVAATSMAGEACSEVEAKQKASGKTDDLTCPSSKPEWTNKSGTHYSEYLKKKPVEAAPCEKASCAASETACAQKKECQKEKECCGTCQGCEKKCESGKEKDGCGSSKVEKKGSK